MAKDPAFLLYSKDFLAGVSDLTMEERGQYITLLCLQQQKGHLSDKTIRLAVGNAAADVLAKFRQDPAGLWYNPRLEQEIEKRAAHGEKQRLRALEGWKKRKNQSKNNDYGIQSGNAAALPLGNANANANANANELNGVEIDFSKPDVPGDTLSFPLDTAPVRELWAAWKKSRWENYHVRYPIMGEQADLKRLQGMTFQQIEEAILAAISGKWKNLHPDKNRSNGKSVNKKQQHTDSLIRGFAERHGYKPEE